jgi:hypothetical protein
LNYHRRDMAGYSETPLPRKLGIKPGARVGLVGAPANFNRTLGELPLGATIRAVGGGHDPFDVIVCFAGSAAGLARDLPGLAARLDPAGGLWIAWPKKSSGLTTDLIELEVRRRGLALGLVDNKVCAIDDTWSGLRFVVRLADRPKGGKAPKVGVSATRSGVVKRPSTPPISKAAKAARR